jgi:hypothetical protein
MHYPKDITFRIPEPSGSRKYACYPIPGMDIFGDNRLPPFFSIFFINPSIEPTSIIIL